MPNVAIYNIEGNKVGEMELSDAVFGVEVSEASVHQVVVAHQAKARQGTQSALTRREVSGGGRKPWRQKGTGRARQGSIRAPQRRHGGVVFAPKPRAYEKAVNKKIRRLAMKSALTSKVLSGELFVLDTLELTAPKTREMVKVLAAFNADKALVVLPTVDEMVLRAAGNLPTTDITLVGSLNVYDLVRHGTLLMTRAAVEKIQEVYAQ
jgi:large subunit ribosomal protein L4